MSAETYDKAVRATHGANDGPMTRARFRALPDWMKTHLQNLTNTLDDAYQEIERLQKRPVEEAREPIFDWSLRNEQPGRYLGDLYAELDILPGVKKPFRVLVYAWHVPTWYTDGSEPGWYQASDFRDSWKAEYHYKHAHQAAECIGKVRSDADAKLICDRAKAAIESGRTRIA